MPESWMFYAAAVPAVILVGLSKGGFSASQGNCRRPNRLGHHGRVHDHPVSARCLEQTQLAPCLPGGNTATLQSFGRFVGHRPG